LLKNPTASREVPSKFDAPARSPRHRRARERNAHAAARRRSRALHVD